MAPGVAVHDLTHLIANITPLVRRVINSIDRHFPTTDAALTNYLLAACDNPGVVSLTRNIKQYCDRYDGRLPGTSGDEGSADYVRNWLLTARVLSDLSGRAQLALPHVAHGKPYELTLYVSCVVHDSSVGSTEKVQSLLPDSVIATPYGLFEQCDERKQRANELRQILLDGGTVPVFRIVSAYGNHLQWSPFWTIGTPSFDLSSGTDLSQQVHRSIAPPVQLSGRILVVRGRIAPRARFVVTPGIAFADCMTDPDTLITTFDGVVTEQDVEYDRFVKERVRPAFVKSSLA